MAGQTQKNKQVLQWVRDFLKLNEKQRRSDLQETEIETWYELKQKIEKALFSTEPHHSDRRRSIRIRDVQLPVFYETSVDKFEGVISEIGEGGLFLSAKNPEPVGSELTLTVPPLDEDSGEELTISAMVIYTNISHSLTDRAFSGMGMKLSGNLGKATMNKWQAMVDALLQEQMAMEEV